jgi:hypothetical protein
MFRDRERQQLDHMNRYQPEISEIYHFYLRFFLPCNLCQLSNVSQSCKENEISRQGIMKNWR